MQGVKRRPIALFCSLLEGLEGSVNKKFNQYLLTVPLTHVLGRTPEPCLTIRLGLAFSSSVVHQIERRTGQFLGFRL